MTASGIEPKERWSNPPRVLVALVVVTILVLGFWVRLKDLSAAPLDVSHSDQLAFLLAARSFQPANGQFSVYLPKSSDYASLGQDLPVLEWLDYKISNLFNMDLTAAARLLEIIGWMLASLIAFLSVRQYTKPLAALALLALMVFMPFSIEFSRVVLPGSWAMVFALLALVFLLRLSSSRSWVTAVFSGLAAMAAALLDPAWLYILAGAVGALLIAGHWQKKALAQSILMLALLFLPRLGVAFWLHRASWINSWLGLQGLLSPLAAVKQLVRLELRLESIMGVLGIGFVLIGVLLERKGAWRSLLVGLWVGFGVMALLFLGPISQSIYHLYPVILLVAFSLLGLFEALLDAMAGNHLGWFNLVVLEAILIIGAGLGMLDGRRLIKANPEQIPVDYWRGLGQKLGKDAVFLSNSNKVTLPLAYYGGVQPGCVSPGGDCTVKIDSLSQDLADVPLYFVFFNSDLEKVLASSSRLSLIQVHCDAGSGVMMIPLTSNHPACDSAGG